MNNEAAVAQSLKKVALNLQAQTHVALVQLNDELNAHARILTTERDDALNDKAETQRFFQENRLSLESIQSEQQRLAKAHEAAISKQQEIHQKALTRCNEKAKNIQEKTAQAETAAQVKIRGFETRLDTLQLKQLQLEQDAQKKANISEAILGGAREQLQSSEASLAMLIDSRNLVENELQSKLTALSAKTCNL